MLGESSIAPGSIPGMECLRSITPLAHLPLPKRDVTLPSAQNRVRELCKKLAPFVGYSRSSTAIERPGFGSGNVGSIPIGSVTFDGPLSLGYR